MNASKFYDLSQNQASIAVPLTPYGLADGTVYIESRFLSDIMEMQRSGEVVSFVPVQMLRVKFRAGSGGDALAQQSGKAKKGFITESGGHA